MSTGLALRVTTTAALTNAFVFFVAHYAELRGDLVYVERQLNLTSHGRFAATRLGCAALRDAFVAAAVASVSVFNADATRYVAHTSGHHGQGQTPLKT